MDKRLFQYKHAKIIVIVIGILTVLQGMMIIAQAVFLARAINLLFQGTAWSAVLDYLLYFLFFFILRHLLQWMRERISYRFAETTALDLQEQLLDQIFRLGPKGISRFGTGDTVTLCLEGIADFRNYLHLFIPRMLAMFVIPAMILLYTYDLDVLSGLVLTLTMPIMILFLVLLGLAAKKKMDDQLTTFQVLSRHFVDSLRGIVTLKFLGKSTSHVKAIAETSERYRKTTMKTLVLTFLSSFNLNFFSSLSIAVLAVELGIRLINGTTMLEIALTVLILAPDYFSPVREFGNDFHATMDGKEAGERIHEILEKDIHRSGDEAVHIPVWNESRTLMVRNLGLRAEKENRMIVEDINFHVEGFQKIGIIGASGAGKSTLINLLTGFLRPTEGSIQIDDGERLEHLSFSAWQKQLTYIPQHPYIFSGSVRENICWYHPEATDAEVAEAVEIAGLINLIEKLPAGLDEKIGQGGRRLSGGEEQRVALARAIVKNSPIMFFDEPTAHLDIETEYDIKQRMIPVMENRLVFFATHRLHWLEQMDLILVMEEGKVVELVTFEEFSQKRLAVEFLGRSQSV